MRYGCRGQGGAARPERGAIVPYRSAMRFGWRIGAALAMLFNAIPATAATPAEDAFVAWARTHAIDLAACSSILSCADYSPLANDFGIARVVALGEPVHCGHETLRLRHC